MAKQNSFDIVSRVDMAEVQNAVNQSLKEVHQRFDLKGSGSQIDLNLSENRLDLTSADEYRLQAVNQILEQKLVRRKVSLKALTYGRVEPAAKGTVTQTINVQQGIPTEKAREIVKIIKSAKFKVQAAIHADQVRISGKNRDTLQEIITLLKEQNLGIDMQFTNYRSQ